MSTDLLYMDAAPTARLLRSFPISRDVASPEAWSEILTPVCQRYGIVSKVRLAMFLANVLHETGAFGRLSESMNYRADRLVAVFGSHRITPAQAQQYGRKPGEGPLSEERQQAIANIVYGGGWGLRNLGNIFYGDGWRFRGAGLMQLTGRSNHERFAKMIGTTADDAYLAKLRLPAGAADSAGHFWQVSGCGLLADDQAVEAVRRRINGGVIGLAEVQANYNRLLKLIDEDTFTPADVPIVTI